MTLPLVRASLRFYWRSHVALLFGVATTVAVLAGALLVGASVRQSLADLAAARLGRTTFVLAAESPFPASLAERLAARLGASQADVAPMLVLDGGATHPDSNRRAQGIAVYGVDERFFAFHQVPAGGPAGGNVLLSPALAAELGPAVEDAVVIRVARPSDVPLDSLHGQRADAGRSIRLTFRGVLDRGAMGEFSLAPAQTAVRAAFVELPRLQAAIDRPARVNTVLIAGAAAQPSTERPGVRRAVREAIEPADLGLTVEPAPGGSTVVVNAASGLLPDQAAAAIAAGAREVNLPLLPVLTWLANRIGSGDRVVPYSLVSAIDPAGSDDPVARLLLASGGANPPPLVLNDWAARDLGVREGDPIRLEYFRWAESGRLVTESADFRLAGVVPMTGLAADRTLAPDYPGITDTRSLADWDPPFPIDLGLVRPMDDEYWERFRTTPKAFIQLEAGQAIWGSRHGRVTSLRVRADDPGAAADRLRDILRTVDPFETTFSLVDVEGERGEAAGGTTDFGAYFSYFSFFLIVSALLLTAVFFRLTVEQRLAQIGVLRAMGFALGSIRNLLIREALIVALAGALLGALLAIGWAGLLMWGLRTWWVGAVGTTELRLYVDPLALAGGIAGGLAAAACSVALVVRGLRRLTPRQLLTGASELEAGGAGRGAGRLAVVSLAAAIVLLGLAISGVVPAAAGFFGAGGLVLAGGLAAFRRWLGRTRARVAGHGRGALWRLGTANASWRPNRSLAAAGLVASAVFLLVAVDSFRKGAASDSGTGGFALFAESTVPILDDPSTPAGRVALGLQDAIADPRWTGIGLVPARLRSGDEVGCLNLYRPMRPRVLGVQPQFFERTTFEFAASTGATGGEGGRPWQLLDRPAEDGAVPAIADATSLRYSLHAAVGDVIEIDADTARPIRLRIVASLQDSLLQGELIVSDAAFRALFPGEAGYRMLFVRVPDATPARLDDTTQLIEERLSSLGVDVERSVDRIAAYHRVENTYISTFQTLGGFGLLLGTLGLAAITARNLLERRRELALLGAAGLTRDDLGVLVAAEQTTVIVAGLLIGLAASILAVAPVLVERGRGVPLLPLAWILVVAVAGGAVALWSARSVRRLPLAASLRGQE